MMVKKEKVAQDDEERQKKHFNLNHGLTLPLKNVQKRKFWRVLKNKSASNGTRFPCPAQLVFAFSSSFVFMEGSRAAVPIGEKVL